MNGVMNETQFAMKKYRAKMKTEKKQIQLNKKMSKNKGIKKQKKKTIK